MPGEDYVIIYVIAPNFKRQGPNDRVPTLDVLVEAYLNILRQFANAVTEHVVRTLRLPPLASGMNAGKGLQAAMP
eukprot:13854629-Alexandrium_andersonii.AAC.1